MCMCIGINPQILEYPHFLKKHMYHQVQLKDVLSCKFWYTHCNFLVLPSFSNALFLFKLIVCPELKNRYLVPYNRTVTQDAVHF